MGVPLIVIPLGIAALLVVGEHQKASRSRWSELARRYPGAKGAELDWTRCSALITEYREEGTLYRTQYAPTRRRGDSGFLNWLWEKLFPLARVAVSPEGLHFKRQLWNYKHPPLMIPWAKIADIKTLTATEYAKGALSRQMGIAAEHIKVPKLLSAIADGGDTAFACVTLASPRMTITLPAEAVADASTYLVPRTPASAPAAPASAPAPAAAPREVPARSTVRRPDDKPATLAANLQPPPRANPLEHLMLGGSVDTMTLMKELTAALISYAPQKFSVFSCTIKAGTEQGKRALFYDIQCPKFPKEGTTVVNDRVHSAATRLVQQMTPANGKFPGISLRFERQNTGKWRSQVKLLAA